MTHLRGSLGYTYSRVVALALVLLLPVAVGCGAAATATPAAKPTNAPAPVAAPKATAVPAPAVVPQAPVVNPGKVTLMVGGFGTERFDGVYGSPGKEYHKAFHGFLVAWDAKDGRMVLSPGIATKWEISSDGLTWTFTIRKGVKFHDGTEVTAADVLWNFQHTMGPEAKGYSKSSPSIAYASIMERIEQTGPDRVSLTFKIPSPEFPSYSSENEGGVTVGVVLPKRATVNGEAEVAAYDRNPIGAGILKLVKQVPLEVKQFERFDDHYYQPKNGLPTDKRPNFRFLDLRLVPEEATRVAALRAGEADIARASLATRKQIEAGGGRVVFGQEAVAIEVQQYGCWLPQFPCHDKRVRQALNYAVDKELMRDKLYGGPEVMQIKGWGSSVTPSTIGYKPGLDPYPYDPAKARQLLADAGYAGGKGFGKLVINTYEDSVVPFLPDSAQLAADLWRRELGLDVEVKLVDKVKITQTRTLAIEDLHGQMVWVANNTRLGAMGQTRHYYFAPYKDGPQTKLHNDPEVFALVGKALAEFDPAESERATNTAYMRLREEAYDVSIGYINAPWGVGPRIVKWEPYPLAEYASALHTIVLK
jgi:peptide/nickel transport system substrate-binding protein